MSFYYYRLVIMISNLSSIYKTLDYPIFGSSTPFSDYIKLCRSLIEDKRIDLKKPDVDKNLIIEANCPYELYPTEFSAPTNGATQYKYGVLLIHGLLDCPFSLKGIGTKLQEKGMLCRALLLPGHGTNPADLMNVSYQDWIQNVRYGIETLRQEAEHIFLLGYSTGAALSVYQALHDSKLAGIILIAPAIKIKVPVDVIVGWHYLLTYFRNNKQWLFRENEIDYTKYQSITFNAINQVGLLTEKINELQHHQLLSCPIFMAVSREDETISSHTAIDFFSSLHHPKSKLLLYSSCDHRYPDARILIRQTSYPELSINHFSHVSIPFAPNNPHYGQHGDYFYASRINSKDSIYGAYNRVEITIYNALFKLGIFKQKRNELTYNPDFAFTVDEIEKFILQASYL
jgi:esterase/lipase